MTLYVLLHGTSISGIFSTREIAEEAAKLTKGYIQTFDLDGLTVTDPGQDFYSITTNVTGNQIGFSVRARLNPYGHKWQQYAKQDYDISGNWRLTQGSYAKSKEHAIKSINELRRQITLAGQKPDTVKFYKRKEKSNDDT